MASSFGAVAGILDAAVGAQAFPCAVAEVGRVSGPVWQHAAGRLTYDDDAADAALDSVFDLASLTKVVATATLCMRAANEGRLDISARVATFIDEWRGHDREDVTIGDLLGHCSGLTAHLPFFRDHLGRAEFQRAIATLPLEYRPRTTSVYSDLGFILLGFVLEDVFSADLRSAFKDAMTALAPIEIEYGAPRGWKPRTVPTGLSTWRGRVLRGEAHDDNCHALGGVAAHAGLFGTAPAVGAFARAVLTTIRGPGEPLARRDTMHRFIGRRGIAGSSRALAWDTMLPTSSCGPRMSSAAIGHTGFTGTSLWIDWERDAYFVLLTNRTYPTADNESILTVRPTFHTAAIAALATLDPAA